VHNSCLLLCTCAYSGVPVLVSLVYGSDCRFGDVCLSVVNGYMKIDMALRTKGGRVFLIGAVSLLFSLGILWVFSGSLLLYVLLLLVFSNTEEEVF
jgi:hypothetical protein